jgi:RNA polymerase sigma-70 factor (ECF subfamily)
MKLVNNYKKYSDEELVSLLRNGGRQSGEAFTEIYRRYSPKVAAYCRGIIKDQFQAEDIFQETFIRFFRGIKAEYEGTNLFAYLIKVARNLSFNSLRNKKEFANVEDFDFAQAETSGYESKELMGLIMNALELLEEKYREAFVLKEFDGLHYEEISEIMDISVTNAKSRVSRARMKISEILSPYIKDLNKQG